MGESTGISWADSTWNPWQGCSKVSPGCKNCYMFRDMGRFGRDPSVVRRSSTATFRKPYSWSRPSRVFACSWSDFFHPGADEWRDDAWDVIRTTPHHTYMLLTKRPELVRERLPATWGDNGWSHVWLGVSIESQEYLHRAVTLSQIPAAKRFISAEPLLGELDLTSVLSQFGWVITGGESGPRTRYCDPMHFLDIRDQCEVYGVPFFHKQNGGTRWSEGARGGRRLDGDIYNAVPDSTRSLYAS